MIRPSTKCRGHRRGNRLCNAPLSAHDPVTLVCPDGSGKTFKHYGYSRRRVSASFSEREAWTLSMLCSVALIGRDAAAWAKEHADDIEGIARKARAMCASLERRSGHRRAAE